MRINTYTCLDCGMEFDSPVSYRETYGLDYGYEDWYCCPHCGGPYAPTHICSGCGQPVQDGYIRLGNGEEYCDDCFLHYNLGEEADWLI